MIIHDPLVFPCNLIGELNWESEDESHRNSLTTEAKRCERSASGQTQCEIKSRPYWFSRSILDPITQWI